MGNASQRNKKMTWYDGVSVLINLERVISIEKITAYDSDGSEFYSLFFATQEGEKIRVNFATILYRDLDYDRIAANLFLIEQEDKEDVQIAEERIEQKNKYEDPEEEDNKQIIEKIYAFKERHTKSWFTRFKEETIKEIGAAMFFMALSDTAIFLSTSFLRNFLQRMHNFKLKKAQNDSSTP